MSNRDDMDIYGYTYEDYLSDIPDGTYEGYIQHIRQLDDECHEAAERYARDNSDLLDDWLFTGEGANWANSVVAAQLDE